MTRTKALGRERIARKLSDAIPGGESPLRAAVRQVMRPMLFPSLAQLNRDAFVLDETVESTVRLEERRGESDLVEVDLGDENASTYTWCLASLPFRMRTTQGGFSRRVVGRETELGHRGVFYTQGCPTRPIQIA